MSGSPSGMAPRGSRRVGFGFALALMALVSPPAANACPIDAPDARAAVEAARSALQASPERPGRWMRHAEALLIADAPADARSCVEAILERWPTAMRARVLGARAALAMDDASGAEMLLAPVRDRGPRVARAEAASLAHRADPWRGEAALTVHADDRAAQVSGPIDTPSSADPAALRLGLMATVERAFAHRRGGGSRVALSGGRTLHLTEDEGGDGGLLDRTWLAAHGRRAMGPLELRASASGTLAGRAGEPYAAGGAVGLAWRGAHLTASLDGGGGWLADSARAGSAPWLGWAVAGFGGHARLGPLRLDARVVGRGRGPDTAFFELGFELEPRVGLGPVEVGGMAHAGQRWLDDRRVGTLGLGARIELAIEPMTVALDAGWQRVSAADFGGPALDRRVIGGRLGVRW